MFGSKGRAQARPSTDAATPEQLGAVAAYAALKPDDLAALRRIAELQAKQRAILAKRPMLVATIEAVERAGMMPEHGLADELAEVRTYWRG